MIPLQNRSTTDRLPALTNSTAPDAPPFDWRKLMALGISLDDAKRIAVNLTIREMVTQYWRKLIELGVPINDAHAIAKAIARYDAAGKGPNPKQRELIERYCPVVCRAKLWRSQIL